MAARYELKASKGGKTMFNLLAANSQIVLTSETYDTKKAAQNGIKSVGKNAANENRFEVKTAKDGQFYFVLKATNGEVIGKSEMYKAMAGVKRGIASVQKNAGAPVVDKTEAEAKPAAKKSVKAK